jgi:hypothetical protein
MDYVGVDVVPFIRVHIVPFLRVGHDIQASQEK